MNSRFIFILSLFFILFSNGYTYAQDGSKLFNTFCATCHMDDSQSRAPTLNTLKQLNPEHVLSALEKGSMVKVGSERSRKERIALAEFVTAKVYDASSQDLIAANAYCSPINSTPQKTNKPLIWDSWGTNNQNTRFQN